MSTRLNQVKLYAAEHGTSPAGTARRAVRSTFGESALPNRNSGTGLSRILTLFCAALFCAETAVSETRHVSLEIGLRSRLIVTPLPSVGIESIRNDSSPHRIQTLPAGPWGNLEYYTFYLQNPDVEKDTQELFSKEVAWTFPGQKEEDAIRQLEKIGISKALLQQQSYMVQVSRNTQIIPSIRLILGLTPEIRAALRRLLRRWPSHNPYYAYPVVIESPDPTAWFARAGLAPEHASRIAPLCYRTPEGNTVLSAVPAALSLIRDPDQKTVFLRSLFRTRTLILRLTIDETSDPDAVRSYWAINNRRKEVLPLFNAIAETRGVEKLDAVHLLPPGARKRLYTFPEGSSPIDCHITTLDFFGISPSWETVDFETWEEAYRTYFIPAKGDLRFGDVIVLFSEETNEAIHAMVYIAADILYTKNGFMPYRPWALMFWEDVLSLYELNSGTYAKVYRHPQP